MKSKMCGADRSSIVKEVGPTKITYELSVDKQGYGLSATAVGEGASFIRIDGLTSNSDTALKILHLLAENLVYPFQVQEVLDDLMITDPFV